MNKTLIEQAAEQLRAAESNNLPCNPIRDHLSEFGVEQRLQTAYQIKQFNHAHWCSHKQSCGVKIGMTSPFIQQLFDITEPDYGHLYQDMQLQPGNQLSLKQLIAPKLEVEWALTLNRDIVEPLDSAAELMKYVDDIKIAFEIVDSRIKNWDVQAVDLIADNGSSGRYLVSNASIKPSEIDLLHQQVNLRRNGELVSETSADENLGNPWEFALWLASKCIDLGAPLRRGDVLLTGTLTPIQEISVDETWTASVPGLAEVSLTVTE